MGLFQMMKEKMVHDFTVGTVSFVNKEVSELNGNNEMYDMLKHILHKAESNNVRDCAYKIKGVSNLSKSDNIAYVKVEFYDAELEDKFNLTFKMTRNDDGTWRIKAPTDIAFYLQDIVGAAEKVSGEKGSSILSGAWKNTGNGDVINVDYSSVKFYGDIGSVLNPFNPDFDTSHGRIRFLKNEELKTNSPMDFWVSKQNGKYEMILELRGRNGKSLRNYKLVKQ